ncbi:MAG: hypothetical protein KGI04_01460 [Candidatus Micrarchaeota archaeon]|nr:hypothetical protein [Candidatus Micrarchaeota archaeon]
MKSKKQSADSGNAKSLEEKKWQVLRSKTSSEELGLVQDHLEAVPEEVRGLFEARDSGSTAGRAAPTSNLQF